MRRKATAKKASPRDATGNANSNIKARENTPLKVTQQIGRPTKTGKGLGKAGAKRLGRLLRRAVTQDQDQESTARGNVSLLKTETEAQNAPETNTAKPAPPHAPQLIVSVVSQSTHRGGISMAELKHTLAGTGYNVTKKAVTQRLVNNETPVRTTKKVSFSLNNKADTKQVGTSSVKSPKLKGILKQSKTASESSKGAEKSPKPAGKKRSSPTNQVAQGRKAPRKTNGPETLTTAK